ncbi:uncharacterized protein LOC119320859 [Triticum dicoccoides]|uniref:uncharacterized protein LOC119320859 n=1 Tax=Triticum dicoccoides TaxID=85692 RepID=UPI001891228F|nr:uncharacterized protein LOC119320859 [Triticum dicoccoides]
MDAFERRFGLRAICSFYIQPTLLSSVRPSASLQLSPLVLCSSFRLNSTRRCRCFRGSPSITIAIALLVAYLPRRRCTSSWLLSLLLLRLVRGACGCFVVRPCGCLFLLFREIALIGSSSDLPCCFMCSKDHLSLQYFQVNYTEENLLDYIDPNNDTLMMRLADDNLVAKCRIMVATDKRTTITTNWSEFRRRANIREGDVCAFRFRITSKRRLVLIVHHL